MENIHQFRDKNLVIIDTSVIVYHLIFGAEKEYGDIFDFDNPQNDPESKEKLMQLLEIALMSIDSLSFLPKELQKDSACVWVADRKPYWRTGIFPEYKGIRNPKPTMFADILNSCRKLFLPVGVTGYEADDCAAAAVKLLSDKVRHTYLLTVDCDWLGLVGERVTWLNTEHHTPKVRGVRAAHEWLLRQYNKAPKYRQQMYDFPKLVDFNPKQIWEFKVMFGDSSDNIRPDHPDGKILIDLLEPPINRRLWRKASFIKQLMRAISHSLIRSYDRDLLCRILDNNHYRGLNFLTQEEIENAKN